MRWLKVLPILLFLALSSCKSPPERVSERVDDLQNFWVTNLAHQADLPLQELNWPQALDLLETQNLRLAQARSDILASREAIRQLFREFIPTLNLRAGVTKQLTSLNTLSFEDVRFNANSFLNIPGLVTFGPRLYAAKLQKFRFETAYELAWREQAIELYKLFLSAENNAQQLSYLENQRLIAQGMSEVDSFSGQRMLTEIELRDLSLRREQQSINARAGELLGDRGFRWVLVADSLPELSYAEDPLPLMDTNRVAELQLKLFAIELEAARVQRLGIQLRYWPNLNIFITSPPLYQRLAGGSERWWDADDLRGSADLYWSIDTRGVTRNQLRQTRRSQALTERRRRQEMIALIDRLLFTQSLMTELREKLATVESQLEVLRAVPPAQNYPALQKYVDDFRSLIDEQRRLRNELAEFNTLFWFIDETAWPEINAEALNATPLIPAE